MMQTGSSLAILTAIYDGDPYGSAAVIVLRH
jgi:hypothetical protein